MNTLVQKPLPSVEFLEVNTGESLWTDMPTRDRRYSMLVQPGATSSSGTPVSRVSLFALLVLVASVMIVVFQAALLQQYIDSAVINGNHSPQIVRVGLMAFYKEYQAPMCVPHCSSQVCHAATI